MLCDGWVCRKWPPKIPFQITFLFQHIYYISDRRLIWLIFGQTHLKLGQVLKNKFHISSALIKGFRNLAKKTVIRFQIDKEMLKLWPNTFFPIMPKVGHSSKPCQIQGPIHKMFVSHKYIHSIKSSAWNLCNALGIFLFCSFAFPDQSLRPSWCRWQFFTIAEKGFWIWHYH